MTAPTYSPTYSDLRVRVAELMIQRGEWAGCPVPIEGLLLDVEKTYPYAGIADCGKTSKDDDSPLDANGLLPGETYINSWYSRRRQCHVYVVRDAEGRTVAYQLHEKPYQRRLALTLHSMKAGWAHGLEAEGAAMGTLAEHIGEEKFRNYMLLGQFIETSKRSRVTYVFRRARPTIALRVTDEGSSVLAVLCMHPIAYYRETFVGAMTPTDDVLAHVLLMRGDEPMFWRRCNQHSPERAEAAL